MWCEKTQNLKSCQKTQTLNSKSKNCVKKPKPWTLNPKIVPQNPNPELTLNPKIMSQNPNPELAQNPKNVFFDENFDQISYFSSIILITKILARISSVDKN